MSREMTNKEAISNLNQLIYGIVSPDIQRSLDVAIKALEERPQDCSDCKRYDSPYFEVTIDKEQLQELVDKAKAEVLASIERPQGKWVPVSERLPEEKLFNPTGSDFGFDFEEVLCTTIWGDVRAYKFGKPIGHDKPHFWLGGGIMDEYVIAWQYKPEPYKKGGAEE